MLKAMPQRAPASQARSEGGLDPVRASMMYHAAAQHHLKAALSARDKGDRQAVRVHRRIYAEHRNFAEKLERQAGLRKGALANPHFVQMMYPNYKREDHLRAAKKHLTAITRTSGVPSAWIAHHKNLRSQHLKAASMASKSRKDTPMSFSDLDIEKGRGVRPVWGNLKSGRAVFFNARNSRHRTFTAADHREAAKMHHTEAKYLGAKHARYSGNPGAQKRIVAAVRANLRSMQTHRELAKEKSVVISSALGPEWGNAP